jgi:hypothetical protein
LAQAIRGVSLTTEASMVNEPMQWYRSKVDWWLVPILCLPPLAVIVVCVALLIAGNTSALPWSIVAVLFVFGIYFGLVFPLRYGLDDSCLLVRFGVCRQRIPLADISEVHPTHNPLSSPALSLNRLHVQYGKGLFKAVLISPADRNRFLDDLARKAGLRREGERLVRA